MNLHVFNIVLAVIAAVGIPGAIILAIAAPALAETLFSTFLNILGRVLSTRLGVGFVVGIGCIIVGELYGTHEANLTCRATIISNENKANAEATARDQDQAKQTDTDVQGRVVELEALNKTNEDKINDYQQQLASRKSVACTLSADDVQRVR